MLDVEAGKQAPAISKNKEVRAFAEQMVKNHTAVNEQTLSASAVGLVKRWVENFNRTQTRATRTQVDRIMMLPAGF